MRSQEGTVLIYMSVLLGADVSCWLGVRTSTNVTSLRVRQSSTRSIACEYILCIMLELQLPSATHLLTLVTWMSTKATCSW
jgi:hypothetical protein